MLKEVAPANGSICLNVGVICKGIGIPDYWALQHNPSVWLNICSQLVLHINMPISLCVHVYPYLSHSQVYNLIKGLMTHYRQVVQLWHHLPGADFGPQHVEEPDLLQTLWVRSVCGAWWEDLHSGGAGNAHKLQPQHAHLRLALHQHRPQDQFNLRGAGHVPPQPLHRSKPGRQVPGFHPKPGCVCSFRVLHLVVWAISGQWNFHGKPRQDIREDQEEVTFRVQQGNGCDARGNAREHERFSKTIGDTHAALSGWAALWSHALHKLNYFSGDPRDASKHRDWQCRTGGACSLFWCPQTLPMTSRISITLNTSSGRAEKKPWTQHYLSNLQPNTEDSGRNNVTWSPSRSEDAFVWIYFCRNSHF